MRVVAVDYRVVTWPVPSIGSARNRTTRTSILVEVRTETGAVGFGEAAPLPGMSIDTLDEARDAIEHFTSESTHAHICCVQRQTQSTRSTERVSSEEPKRSPRQPMASQCPLCSLNGRSSSAQFAIETALFDALGTPESGRGDGVDLVDLWPEVDRICTVPSAVVADDVQQARDAVARGATHLKIKVGDSGDLERIRAIANAVPGRRLRLDANRSWPRKYARERLAALADLPIEFVEEPCEDAHRLLDERLALPIALDESLATLSADELAVALRSRSLAAIILKPTLLGGIRACLDLAHRARAAGVRTIVTHTLEGPVGTAACRRLASMLDGEVHGLAPHPALAAWRTHDVEPASLDALLATLDDPLARWVPAIKLQPSLDETPTVSVPEVMQRSPFETRATRTPEIKLHPSLVEAPIPHSTRVVVAAPTAETLEAFYAALADRVPIALIHHALPVEEQERQRVAVEAAKLPADAAVVLFTSGSTGAARGVVLSRAALLAAADASAAHLGWRDDDRWLLALSLAHAGGLAIAIRCLVANKPLTLVERATRIPDDCTLASLVPTQLASLLDDPTWRPPQHLRAVLLGGAAASPALLAAAAARGVPFLVTYGMTETLGQIATAPVDRAGDPSAPLVALSGVELSTTPLDIAALDVRHPDEKGTKNGDGPHFAPGQRLTTNGDGSHFAPKRISVRGPMLATCYLDGEPIAPKLVTRDLGFVEDGVLHVVGRVDDMIITGGENVSPSAIESVVATTAGVRAACAFGIEDERWGQRVAVAVATTPEFDRERAAVAWHAALPPHARPRELAIVSALPQLANGKVDRRAAARLPRAAVRYS